MKTLSERLLECAEEVASFPHPSACDHLHDASALMREAAYFIALIQGESGPRDRFDLPVRIASLPPLDEEKYTDFPSII